MLRFVLLWCCVALGVVEPAECPWLDCREAWARVHDLPTLPPLSDLEQFPPDWYVRQRKEYWQDLGERVDHIRATRLHHTEECSRIYTECRRAVDALDLLATAQSTFLYRYARRTALRDYRDTVGIWSYKYGYIP